MINQQSLGSLCPTIQQYTYALYLKCIIPQKSMDQAYMALPAAAYNSFVILNYEQTCQATIHVMLRKIIELKEQNKQTPASCL